MLKQQPWYRDKHVDQEDLVNMSHSLINLIGVDLPCFQAKEGGMSEENPSPGVDSTQRKVFLNPLLREPRYALPLCQVGFHPRIVFLDPLLIEAR